MAAVLCECQYAPASLVRRLSNERIDIAAPVLIRSNVLTDFDLVALIGRHGAGHARAIARRPGLNPAIASLAALIDRTSNPARPSPHRFKTCRHRHNADGGAPAGYRSTRPGQRLPKPPGRDSVP